MGADPTPAIVGVRAWFALLGQQPVRGEYLGCLADLRRGCDGARVAEGSFRLRFHSACPCYRIRAVRYPVLRARLQGACKILQVAQALKRDCVPCGLQYLAVAHAFEARSAEAPPDGLLGVGVPEFAPGNLAFRRLPHTVDPVVPSAACRCRRNLDAQQPEHLAELGIAS